MTHIITTGAPPPESEGARIAYQAKSDPEIKEQQSPEVCVDLDAERKAFLTLQAKYAILGFGLDQLASGELLVHRWCYSRALPDMRAASVLLRQLGGAA